MVSTQNVLEKCRNICQWDFPSANMSKFRGFALVDPLLLATSPHVPLHLGTEPKVIIKTYVLSSTVQSLLNRPAVAGGFVDARAPETDAHHENDAKTKDRTGSLPMTKPPLGISDHLLFRPSDSDHTFDKNQLFVAVTEGNSDLQHIDT